MKTKSVYFLLLSAALFIAGCGKDNYEPPKSVLTGKVVYNGQNIGVKGTNNAVRLELWQRGYQLFTSIPVYVTQDGTFTAYLFDGDYKLVSIRGNGPWESKQDSVSVKVKGDTQVEYPVTPFYTISNETFTLNGNKLTATFTINFVSGAQAVDRAILVVNKTIFVDETAQIARVDKTNPGTGQITMTLDLNETVMSNVLLTARVGVKVSGREAIYSAPKKIK